ncbi:xanthine dehydrogenase accessory protein XdhC [Yoonia sp. 208BN28-4]|uniref:xanthine dehydrogenase accessory protein XdhC n=1 Tax=Yoonia sp. 208BN28-4 TaxID=3126505 RepID=UPI0030A8740B
MAEAVWIEVIATRGSAPRDAGTAMMVTADATEGTIGGGALEYQAIEKARAMLGAGEENAEVTWPLGPGLGQCCGGAVTLRFGREARAVDVPQTTTRPLQLPDQPLNLWLWGAGHVGRAVVSAAHPAAFTITWIDRAPDRFPANSRDDVTTLPAANMPLLASKAPANTHHLIFTYSHDIDLALCDALLRRPVASIGLIGSATKWRRFQTRLGQLGHQPDEISRITCPIGQPALGKKPDDIASGVIAAYLETAGAELRPARGRRQA